MRLASPLALLLVLVFSLGCDRKSEGPSTADLAELTTRQLIAGLNANNKQVLQTLVVVTSTTGGAPRALRSEESARIIYPDGPFEYLGAGKPGLMMLRDGKQNKRAVRLIRVGEAMKVLATSESYAAYSSREYGGGSVASLTGDTRVLSIMIKD